MSQNDEKVAGESMEVVSVEKRAGQKEENPAGDPLESRSAWCGQPISPAASLAPACGFALDYVKTGAGENVFLEHVCAVLVGGGGGKVQGENASSERGIPPIVQSNEDQWVDLEEIRGKVPSRHPL